MKKALCMVLVLVLAMSLCPVSFAEGTEEIPGTVDVPYAGFRFVPPELFRDTAGSVTMDGVAELSDGVYYAYWMYYAMTEEEKTAWLNDHNPDAPAETRVCPLFFVLILGNGMTFQSFNALNGNAIQTQFVRELGKLGEVTYCLYMEEPNPDLIEAIDSPFREEYIALASAADDVAAGFSFYKQQEKPDPYAGLVGSRFEFTAADLDGNAVSSADMFAQSEITMVNIWATWCGPCIAELPLLQELHARLQESDCSIVGMLIDDDLEAARSLMEENGITYPVIFAPETLLDLIPLDAIPTTLFIGRDGTVLAAPVVGAHPDQYEAVMEALLSNK